jgi:hypothetical protein
MWRARPRRCPWRRRRRHSWPCSSCCGPWPWLRALLLVLGFPRGFASAGGSGAEVVSCGRVRCKKTGLVRLAAMKAHGIMGRPNVLTCIF